MVFLFAQSTVIHVPSFIQSYVKQSRFPGLFRNIHKMHTNYYICFVFHKTNPMSSESEKMCISF